jgi:glutathione S-transferase
LPFPKTDRINRGNFMNGLTLVIGNKNYSSWSLRPWFVLKQCDIPFREIRIPIYAPGSREEILRHSPAGRVPVLHDGDTTVWESLAICEYLAERFPKKQLWPADRTARALARSISNEMHAGFGELRKHMTMDCRKHHPGKGRTPEAMEDVARITSIWSECRQRFGRDGDFLFGHFTIADAMYAPVVLRFETYGVELGAVPSTYTRMILALPALRQWVAEAHAETEVVPELEPYG